MVREVVWTVPALEQLREAAEFIARDSERHAQILADRIVESAASLSSMPDRGQVVPELGDDTIREILIKPYRLVYQIRERGIFIIAILHGARRHLR